MISLKENKFNLIYTPLIFIAVFVTISLINRTYAQDEVQLEGTITCQAEETVFKKVIDMTDLDIRRTALNHMISVVIDGVPYALIGKNSSQIQRCGAYYLQDHTNASIADSCRVETAAEECDDLSIVYTPGSNFAQNQTSGTLVGIANLLQGAAINEPVPTNMAYWWNDNVSRIPFAGKALAQDDGLYQGPFLGVVLAAWKWVRNVSYGLMSLVLLVTGFMIITRKKIGAQLAVTAQQAIPRIVVALVLITFSYPIGAFGARFAYVMQGNAVHTAKEIFSASGSTGQTYIAGESMTAGVIVAIMLTVVSLLMPGAAAGLFIVLAVLLVALVLYLLAYVKFAIIYLKLLFSIIGAPLVFTLGAIPGNEKQTETWFRRFAAHVLSLPAIVFVLELTFWLSIEAIKTSYDALTLGGAVWTVLILPFFLVFGFSFARKVPDIIETNLVGDDKKRR